MQTKNLQALFSGIASQQPLTQDVEVLSQEMAAQLKSGSTARLPDDLLAAEPDKRRAGVGSWLQRVGQVVAHWGWSE